MPCFILFSRFIIDLSFKIKGVSTANKINYIYIYIYIYIIIIIRVWTLAWMNEKAELIKSFNQCDCGGKNYV